MTHSPLTNGIQLTSDFSSRYGTRVDRFIVHHAATTSLAAILSLFMPGGREVSAHYALGADGTLVQAVDEDNSPWTSAAQNWDRRAITIEVANSIAGGSWPVSDASFDKLARLIADRATFYGFPIDDEHILTHQELYIRYGDSYATACPGGIQPRKPELIALARHYQSQASTAGNGTTPVTEHPSKRGTKMADITFYARVRPDGKGGLVDDGDWTIGGADLFEDPEANKDFEKTRIMTYPGYWATDSAEVAKQWGRQFSFYPPETLAVRLGAEPYVAQQKMLTDLHKRWVRGMKNLFSLGGV